MLNNAATQYAMQPYLNEKGNRGWKSITFREAKNKALVLASGLLELGAKYEDKIAILSEAKNDWILSELAIIYRFLSNYYPKKLLRESTILIPLFLLFLKTL